MHTGQLPGILRVYPTVSPGENPPSYESQLVWGKLNDVNVAIRVPYLLPEPGSHNWYYCLVSDQCSSTGNVINFSSNRDTDGPYYHTGLCRLTPI